ncbi:MAG: hypothetical protein KIT84_22700 [Labilithrix sp.]|nr:hypothetical protein [Labilithrix sp.]
MGRNARAKAKPRVEAPAIDRAAGSALGLRLAIGREGLGIELARTAALACVDVVELVVRLPNVRFPFDVTGGVTKFRHRRGELERVAIELDARKVARWAEPRLRGLLGPERPTLSILPRAFGATIAVLDGAAVAAPPALAFEVALVAAPQPVLVVHGARGANLPAPATVLALRAMTMLLGEHATREGARFSLPRLGARIARALLPDAGVRAPGGDDVVLAGSGESDGVLFVAFARAPAEPAIPRPRDARARGGAPRPRGGRRALRRRPRGRAPDLAALERAPRHGEIARHRGAGRLMPAAAEAAIATLRSADRLPTSQLLGDLLVEAGDADGAIAALLREGRARSRRWWRRSRSRARRRSPAIPPTRCGGSIAAIARPSALLELRWSATRRLAQGRLADARADFQELEAVAIGAPERHRVLRRAADVYRARGLGADAALLYERALLYRPDDPDAVAGLGVALAAEGRGARGATLLARAIELREREVPPPNTAWMQVALARVLADRLGDRSAAVARLRLVADEAAEAIEARGLEGRYRAALGDAAGASLAFARLRERAGRDPAALPWLDEAATFEEGRGELALAQAHLAVALAIAPDHADLDGRYRTIGARLGRAARSGHDAPFVPSHDSREVRIAILPEPDVRDRATLAAPPVPGDVKPAPVRDRTTLAAPPESTEDKPAPIVVEHLLARATESASESTRETLSAPASGPRGASTPEEDEVKVEALTRTLQGDPTNDAVVDELAERLTRLGRSMELLALLSARLEDAPPDRRAELLPRHHAVLERLELEARAAGRDGEADLFRMARDSS